MYTLQKPFNLTSFLKKMLHSCDNEHILLPNEDVFTIEEFKFSSYLEKFSKGEVTP